MGAAILLRSHDCLQGRLPNDALSLTALRRNPNSKPNPNTSRRRRRSPVASYSNSQDNRDPSGCSNDRPTLVVKSPGANLVMGQVKILKRGEKLTLKDEPQKPKEREERFDFALGSTDRLGPDPEMVKEQIRVPDLKSGVYAGTAFVESPPPSSVPVPVFLRRNRAAAAADDLRRLLRLDLMVSACFLYLFKRIAVEGDDNSKQKILSRDEVLFFGP